MIITFSTSNGKYSFVKLGESKFNIGNSNKHIISNNNDVNNWSYNVIKIRKTFTIIGLTDELTEEQWSEVVDYVPSQSIYKNYNGLLDQDFDCNTATKSGKSLMESLKIYHENPYGKVPPHNIGLLNNYPTGNIVMDKSLALASKWLNAQKKTSNWLLIKYI